MNDCFEKKVLQKPKFYNSSSQAKLDNKNQKPVNSGSHITKFKIKTP